MESKEKQRILAKIKKILNAACMESICMARYTIEECDTERGIYLLLFVYNRQGQVIESRLSDYNNMIEIAIKIRKKVQNQLKQCQGISKIVFDKYNVGCCIEVIKHHDDTMRAELYFADGTKTLSGSYYDIVDEIKYRM